MEMEPKLNLFFGLCLVLIKLVFHVGSTVGNGRKLIINDKNPGFISIDCGAPHDYLDKETGMWYQTDTNFIETGTNSMALPSVNLDYPYFGGLLNTLRSFPEGRRNCYTLKPDQGKHRSYLIRTYFAYGNYDAKNHTPIFDLYLGVNHWDTIDLEFNNNYHISEIIHTPTTDSIHVCLVKTVVGVPFISALELRPFSSSIYQTPSPSQSIFINRGRFDVATTSSATHSRYKDDIYDRTWRKIDLLPNWYQINGSVDIDPSRTNDPYKLPSEVLKSAARSWNISYALNYDYDSIWKHLDKSSKYFVYFHFCEIQQLPPGHKRIININITVGDEYVYTQPIILDYLKPQTIAPQIKDQGYVRFSISATSKSYAPPILNAFEVYQFISPLPSPTDQTDVDAIIDVKDTYKISNLDWQGDPCVPNLAWHGLNCSSGFNGTNSRVTSVNLSSTKLTGKISTSFSKLTELESLDLSFNDLSGSIPEFLAELPKLRVLNLSGNKLMGSVPKSLEEKSYATLQLSLGDNPGLCLVNSCIKHNSVIPIAASVSAFALVFMVSFGVWIFKTKNLKGKLKQKKLLLEIGDIAIPFSVSSKRKFCKGDKTGHEIHIFNFKSIVLASNNFSSTNKLGEGGFGPVYKGRLLDGREIAIKRLSKCSKQGLTEFKNEVKLIAKLQHTNLVRLYGFCIEGQENMLIYEYLPNKSLDFYLYGHNNRILLDWKTRVNIIQGIAQGLVYLHKYSRLKVIHRDLKPSNILLDHEMCPKISDFGMARIFGMKEFEQENTNRVVGTYGYMSPEYALSGIVSVKTDIFSFGVLLLEIVSARKNTSFCNSEDSLNLIGYAWKLWNEGRALELVDPSLSGTWDDDEILRCIHIGLLCVQDQAKDRPDMSDVVSYLSNETILLAEPKQPAFFSCAIENKASSPANITENCSTYNVTISDFNGR